jgi:hypothetical protein
MASDHRRINYDLCTALDLTKLGLALDRMIANGMSSLAAGQYRTMALALLTLLRGENDRLAPAPPSAEGEAHADLEPCGCGHVRGMHSTHVGCCGFAFKGYVGSTPDFGPCPCKAFAPPASGEAPLPLPPMHGHRLDQYHREVVVPICDASLARAASGEAHAGTEACGSCGGSGYDDEHGGDCGGCNGEGWVECAPASGEAHAPEATEDFERTWERLRAELRAMDDEAWRRAKKANDEWAAASPPSPKDAPEAPECSHQECDFARGQLRADLKEPPPGWCSRAPSPKDADEGAERNEGNEGGGR